MKIGIIGVNQTGITLGKILAEQKHTISFGVKNKKGLLVKALPGLFSSKIEILNFEECIDSNEIIFLILPWEMFISVLKEIPEIKNKILVDLINNFNLSDNEKLPEGMHSFHYILNLYPDARIIKLIHTGAGGRISQNSLFEVNANSFLCSDFAEEKTMLKDLLENAGLNIFDGGNLSDTKLYEDLREISLKIGSSLGYTADVSLRIYFTEEKTLKKN